MRTSFSKISVVDELTENLASRRSRAMRRSGAYRRLALAILDPVVPARSGKPVELRSTQTLVTAA
jgi:hypothetical protein